MSCKLELINKPPYYIPGTKIEGQLVCCLSKTREVEVIEVRFFGRESANVKVMHEVLFNSERSICYVQAVILKNAVVELGKTVYDFKIQIPKHIPSTYVGAYGSIRYDLEGLLMLTQQKRDNSQISIQIFSPVDTRNFAAGLHKPMKLTDQKDLIGICGSGGQISSSLQIDKKVFLCGESINMNVTIRNATGRKVRRVRACLMETASCKLPDGKDAVSKGKILTKRVYKTNVEKGEEKTFEIALTVPDDLLLPNMKQCMHTIPLLAQVVRCILQCIFGSYSY